MRSLFAAALLAGPAAAQIIVPAPVHGITFDEYASASARLAAGRPVEQVLGVLHVTRPQYDEASAAFAQAMKDDATFELVQRFGAAFGDPRAGRFAALAESPKPAAIDSFEDYARIQGELTAAVEAGRDPVAVLRDQFGMTPFDWSQSSGPWLHALTTPNEAERVAQLHALDAAVAEARARYGLPPRQ